MRDHSASPMQLSGMVLLLPGEDRPRSPPSGVTRYLFEPSEEVKAFPEWRVNWILV